MRRRVWYGYREMSASAAKPVLFGATLFVGAALLFCVQPMIAKMVLPKFGGAPAVWNTCMVFFQAALLAGYVYAHASVQWLRVRRQSVLHLGILALPWLVLPIAVGQSYAPPTGADPVLPLLALLSVTAGLPFFVVATSAPLVQRWFADSGHRAANDPYFLYAASNAGSMLGLLSYPLVVEPRLSLSEQSKLWTAGYALLTVLTAACAVVLWRSRGPAVPDRPPAPARRGNAAARESQVVQPWTRLRWVALSFTPSSLMLGVTTYLTTDVAPIPMLWVVPLALYLLSFILVFSRLPGGIHRLMLWALPAAVVWQLSGAFFSLQTKALAHLVGFFAAAMVCHGELALSRPSAARLTEFYLWISFGGMLGGSFNALVAPMLFDGMAEYPLALVLACLLAPPPWGRRRAPRPRLLDFLIPPIVGLTAAVVFFRWSEGPPAARTLVVVALCLASAHRPLRFGLSVGAVLGAAAFHGDINSHVAFRQRSFYGAIKVLAGPNDQFVELWHGNIKHGMQRQTHDPSQRNIPLLYYYPNGPIGQVFETLGDRFADQRLAIIGLGVGSLAAYGRQGQEMTFYEIDPDVQRIAQNDRYFTFLRDSQATINVVLGDARLSLSREPDEEFALIVLDAFSGDAIPVHLLSKEAMELYRRKLAPGGLIAAHVSNYYVNLSPVLGNIASVMKLVGRERKDTYFDPATDPDGILGKAPSRWVLLAEHQQDFGPLATDPRWIPLATDPKVGVWTDDFSNLLEVFEWPKPVHVRSR